MDARKFGIALSIACVVIITALARQAEAQGARVASRNFIVYAANPQQAQEALQTAENYRSELAMLWLGEPLPDWQVPCPIKVRMSPNLGAGGKTTFTLDRGTVTHWDMEVFGSRERVLDSVLPHEITHTILATHFSPLGKPVPRWADEGACTTVEHKSERSKHDQFLVQFMSTGRALPFATMFTLRDYPNDIMPLYAQGYSVASFLIAQQGHQTFVKFLEDGMRTEDWVMAVERHYGYPLIGKLQVAWNKWVADGGGNVENHTAVALGLTTRNLGNVASTTAPLNNSLNNFAANDQVRLASAVGNGPVTGNLAAPEFPKSARTMNTPEYVDSSLNSNTASIANTDSSGWVASDPPSMNLPMPIGFRARPGRAATASNTASNLNDTNLNDAVPQDNGTSFYQQQLQQNAGASSNPTRLADNPLRGPSIPSQPTYQQRPEPTVVAQPQTSFSPPRYSRPNPSTQPGRAIIR